MQIIKSIIDHGDRTIKSFRPMAITFCYWRPTVSLLPEKSASLRALSTLLEKKGVGGKIAPRCSFSGFSNSLYGGIFQLCWQIFRALLAQPLGYGTDAKLLIDCGDTAVWGTHLST